MSKNVKKKTAAARDRFGRHLRNSAWCRGWALFFALVLDFLLSASADRADPTKRVAQHLFGFERAVFFAGVAEYGDDAHDDVAAQLAGAELEDGVEVAARVGHLLGDGFGE